MKVIFSDYNSNDDHFHCNFTGIIIDSIGDVCFYKNGYVHNTNGPAKFIREFNNLYVCYLYKNEYYGCDRDYTTKTWKQKVKKLKRRDKLNIFI